MAYNNNWNNSNNNYNGGNGGKYNNRGGGKKKDAPGQLSTSSVFLNNADKGKFLQIKYWAKTMGMEIGSYQPNTILTPEVINNTERFGHVFSYQSLCEIVDMCEEILDSMKETGTFETSAVLAGQKRDTIVEISNGDNLGLPTGIYLVIYRNVDQGRRSTSFNFYPFASTVIMKGYNRNTGEAVDKVKPTGDFKKFLTCIREAMKAFTLAQAHAVNELVHVDKAKTRSVIFQIAQNMGISAGSFNDGSSYQKSGNKGNYQQNGNNGYQRKSQPGQYNPGGQYNNQQSNYQPGSYPARQPSYQEKIDAVITNEPTEVVMDASVLRQTNSLDSLG